MAFRIIPVPKRMEFADRLVRVVGATPTQSLRVAYLRAFVSESPIELVAAGLDEVFYRAERGDDGARDVLTTFVTVIQMPEVRELISRLRTIGNEKPLYGLSALLPALSDGKHGALHVAGAQTGTEQERKVPDYGKGRPLTLGERKSLARRSDRATLDRLLLDPHPVVIRFVLRNPLTTEDDVVRLAAKRPIAPMVLREIVASTRWSHRQRVRLAVLFNPRCPVDLGMSLVHLLTRPELRMMLRVGDCQPDLVRAASKRLQRMVEVEGEQEKEGAN